MRPRSTSGTGHLSRIPPGHALTAMQRHHWISVLLVLLTIAAFSGVRHLEFVLWDDNKNVYENPHLRPVSWASVLRFWRAPYFTSYVPVTRSVWAGLAGLSALSASNVPGAPPDPQVFHLANLAVHVLNVLLVFAILRKLVDNDWACWAGALLFALHPVQVEPVAWVTGMKDLLGGLFGLLALWSYLSYAVAAKEGATAGAGRAHYALATCCYVLALLSKPSAVAVPVMAWVLDCWAVKRPARQATLALIGWVAAGAAAAVLGGYVEREGVEATIGTPIWPRPLVAGDALAFYLWKLAVPLRLAPDYGRRLALVLAHKWGYLTWLVPCALAVLVWLRRASWPLLVASAGVFVAALLPVLGFVPFRFQGYSTVADRYLYLAMLGPALALAWVLARRQSKVIWTVCLTALTLAGLQTTVQTLHWRNTFALFVHTLEINPNSWTSYTNLGAALKEQGEIAHAMTSFRRALAICPDDAGAHFGLGRILQETGRMEEAAVEFRAAVRSRPYVPEMHDYLGIALGTLGRNAEAQAHWAEALRLDPEYASAHHNLAISLYAQGRAQEAIEHWREALRVRPDFARAQRSLAQVLEAEEQARRSE